MQPPPVEHPLPDSYPCPECGSAVPADADGGAILQCPRCGTQFFLPADPDEIEHAAPEDAAAVEAPSDADAELSALRIRQVSALRRGAYRARSYCIIGAAVCGVAVVNLILRLAELLRHHRWQARWVRYGVLYTVLAMAAAYGLVYFVHRINELTREVRRPSLQDPATPPDFSTLSDGSHHVRDLEAFGSAGPLPTSEEDHSP